MTKMDKIIRQLIEADPTISLVLDEAPDIFIVPVILDKDSTEKEKNIGRMEYQVSDGAPADRGYSYDVYSWKHAKETALEMSKEKA